MTNPSSESPFSDPDAVARYAEGPPRIVPGYAALLRMTTLLLEERVPSNGRVLVLGAGGGLELKTFAQAQPTWSFDGVDPAAEMLKLAEQTLATHSPRVQLHHGYIHDAPAGPFDAATCVLTMHFVAPEERQGTIDEVHRRLKPGSPFVMAHLSIPEGERERETWLSRYAAFTVACGTDPEKAQAARTAIASRLTILSPEQDEATLRDAGFSDVSLFYAGFAFRGWVAYA